jgi:hypothetical protein
LTKTPTKPEKAQPARHVSFRLPPDVIEALDKAAVSSHLSKTKVLELTLRAGLNRFLPAPVVVMPLSASDPAQLSLFK